MSFSVLTHVLTHVGMRISCIKVNHLQKSFFWYLPVSEKNFFSKRVMTVWNVLPGDVVAFTSLSRVRRWVLKIDLCSELKCSKFLAFTFVFICAVHVTCSWTFFLSRGYCKCSCWAWYVLLSALVFHCHFVLLWANKLLDCSIAWLIDSLQCTVSSILLCHHHKQLCLNVCLPGEPWLASSPLVFLHLL